jgi:pimeloyl-ACP methyl ester carboxylesterase
MKRLALFLQFATLAAGASPALAQELRTVDVAGRQVRVQTAGLDSAQDGAPVVVFEAGFMYDGISAWSALIGQVADFAPVIAYDRAGIGGSEADGEVPTPDHVVANLHAVLEALDAPPPYVLVGHSLGGPFIRMYAARYPDEVAGLVYVDPSDWMSLEESREYDRAMGISVEGREALNASVRATFPDLPNASVRAEAEMMFDPRRRGWPEFQDLPPMPDVPVVVLMAARFEPQPRDAAERDCEPRECHERRIAFRRAWLANVADEVTLGTLIVVKHTGHFIQNDDPELVAWSIRRVIEADAPRTELRLPRSVLEEYVGRYEVTPEAGFTVTLEGDQLFAQYGNQRPLPVFSASESEFFYRAVDAALSFQRDDAGVVTRLVLHQNGRDAAFERVR